MGIFFIELGAILVFAILAEILIAKEKNNPNRMIDITLIGLGYFLLIVIVFMPFEPALCYGLPASIFLTLFNLNFNERVAKHGLYQFVLIFAAMGLNVWLPFVNY